jgi:hypothetical protein
MLLKMSQVCAEPFVQRHEKIDRIVAVHPEVLKEAV